MSNEIKIDGKLHPVRYTMGAIERIFVGLDITDFSQLAEKLDNKTIGRALSSIKVIAFEGIAAGYKHLAVKCPFNSADELSESVTKFTELTPCLPLFNQAVTDFFHTDEETGEAVAVVEKADR